MKSRTDAGCLQLRTKCRSGDTPIKTSHQPRACDKRRSHRPQITRIHTDITVIHHKAFMTRVAQHLQQIADFHVGAEYFRADYQLNFALGKFRSVFRPVQPRDHSHR